MNLHRKLFDNSEIEYITPFLKLWMSFNNWYKKDLKGIRIPDLNSNGNQKQWNKGKKITTDGEAIKFYKKKWKIKDEFLIFSTLEWDASINFTNALFELVLNIKKYNLQDKEGNRVSFYKKNSIWNKKEIFQILEQEQDLFFQNILEIMYQVRCNLVHGSFDIENKYFLRLVENSYKILYPIMEIILGKEEHKNKLNDFFHQSYFDNIIEKTIDLLATPDLSSIKKIMEVLYTSIDYSFLVKQYLPKIQNTIYCKILGKTAEEVMVLRKETRNKRKSLFASLTDNEKDNFEKAIIKIILLAKQKAENKIPMTMKDWEKEITNIEI